MKLLLLLLVATATAGIAAAAASASGPAAPGKELAQVTCDGLGTITVSVQPGGNANGAAQIVDAKGHGIPVEATLTATHCSGVLFQGPASDFFGTDLPLGVAPTDTVQLTIDGLAVIKL